jgi:copper chaperone NosL
MTDKIKLIHRHTTGTLICSRCVFVLLSIHHALMGRSSITSEKPFSRQEGFAMKREGIVMVLVLLVAALTVFAQGDDIKQHPSCKYCGMDREKFGHSRMLIEYDDGTSVGTCSVHCVAVDLALNIDKTPKVLMVGDFNTKKLTDAEKATWVIGGNKPGVMTKRAKWAFEKKEDADKFIKENGGTLATFDEAVKLAYEDMYHDTNMIREKRKMKKSGMEHQHPK